MPYLPVCVRSERYLSTCSDGHSERCDVNCCNARVGASFLIADFSLYERLPERKAEVDELLGRDGGEVVWNDANEKSRELLVKLPSNLAPNYWNELYPWIADRLLGIHKIAG